MSSRYLVQRSFVRRVVRSFVRSKDGCKARSDREAMVDFAAIADRPIVRRMVAKRGAIADRPIVRRMVAKQGAIAKFVQSSFARSDREAMVDV